MLKPELQQHMLDKLDKRMGYNNFRRTQRVRNNFKIIEFENLNKFYHFLKLNLLKLYSLFENCFKFMKTKLF